MSHPICPRCHVPHQVPRLGADDAVRPMCPRQRHERWGDKFDEFLSNLVVFLVILVGAAVLCLAIFMVAEAIWRVP